MPERAGHAARDPTDYYVTTPDLALLTCQAVADRFPGSPQRILEPGCGSGNYLDAIKQVWPDAELVGIEIHDELAAYSQSRGFHVELRDLLENDLGRFDLIIGNPPFRHANRLVPLLHQSLLPGGVLGLLLRLNFAESEQRYPMFQTFIPHHLWAMVCRPGFTPNGSTDATAVAFWTWQQGWQGCHGDTTFSWLDNRFIENRWSQGRRAVKHRKTGQVLKPEILDDRFPDPRRESHYHTKGRRTVQRSWF